jgi:hypothetical protein
MSGRPGVADDQAGPVSVFTRRGAFSASAVMFQAVQGQAVILRAGDDVTLQVRPG